MSNELELREALYQRELEIERLTAELEALRDAAIRYLVTVPVTIAVTQRYRLYRLVSEDGTE